MSPRRRKVEDADVFAAMGRVMRRVGPAELTLRAIAKEAGVTAGALVQRFGSKRELILAHWRQAATGPGTPPAPAGHTRLPCRRYETPPRSSIEVTLGGSFLAWTLHREGSAATRISEDLDATLKPYLTRKSVAR
jgi:AcrR family transcriptional regulator